ncbi:tRNA lysidine(34) synthetase TilS [Clostridium cylindrosporum]|nr:tRNA lysidine(34) synthetase TilS [Clostridium cylindrosporum]
MLCKVKNTIEINNMISHGDNIVVGFSGGPDSLSLLHILLSLKDEYNLSIHAAHVNHMIRGEEATRDEEFSRLFSRENNITFHLLRVDVNSLAKKNKISSEEAGRKVRYEFFNDILDSIGGGKIALAHNLNDNAETIIMRILRGTSISGMGGISPVRENIIRPIINCRREEIEKYCIDNNLNPVIDSTNLEEIYTRNKIRLKVIPYIKENFNKNILENLHANSHIARDEEDMITSLAREMVKNIKRENGYSLEEFNKLHIAMKRRVLRCIIESTFKSLKGIESKHIDLIINLINKGESGKKLDIKKGLVLRINYGVFNIILEEKKSKEVDFISHNILKGRIIINGYSIDSSIINREEMDLADSTTKYFDLDKISGEVVVRLRQNGDYMYLKGLNGKKKLKDIFIDMKIQREVRDSIPIIAVGSEVLVIPFIKESKSYKIDNSTNKILKVKVKECK